MKTLHYLNSKESLEKSLVFLLATVFVVVPCLTAQGKEQLVADVERSYVLETEMSAIVTVQGYQWALQAEFPRGDVLEGGRLVREINLQARKAQLHFGPHVDIAFRVPAGPPVPPAYRDHVSYDATDVQVRFFPPPDSQKRKLLVLIAPFAANGKTYQVKLPAGEENPIPLRIRVPLP
jgi:hypothetical protein